MQAGHGRGTGSVVAAAGLLLATLFPVAAASGAGDVAAEAPVRTIASAQDFLEQVLPGNHYISTPMAEMVAKARRDGLRGSFEPLPLIFEAEPVAPCVTRLRADVSPTWFVVLNPQDEWDGAEASVEALLGGPWIGNPDGMHFGSIRALRRSGSRLHIRFAGNADDAELHLDAAETAARVHEALEFLRLHCDATRRTGF